MRTNTFIEGDKVSWFDSQARQTVVGHIREIVPGGRGIADRAIISHKKVREFKHYHDINIGCWALTMIENAK